MIHNDFETKLDFPTNMHPCVVVLAGKYILSLIFARGVPLGVNLGEIASARLPVLTYKQVKNK
jgi:hypothetical protein